jgi:nucleoside-diphosphate-sugar epimerase
MRVLLTGACGLIGGATAQLGAGEHEFVGLDIDPAVEKAGGVRASVEDRDALLRAAEGCDAILHTAALHGHFAYTATAEQYIRTNVVGTQNVFEAALAHGIRRVVVASSLTVNVGLAGLGPEPRIIDEDSAPLPDHMYPVTKLMAEDLGHYHARVNDLEVVQLRYSYVRPNVMANNGLGLLGRAIGAEDVARANLLSLTRPGLTDHVLIIGAEAPFDEDDLRAAQADPLGVIERHWPGSASVLRGAGCVVEPRHLSPMFCIARAKRVLGWRPRITFETYLRHLGWRRPAEVRA